jgi:hypothetical protein
LLDYLSNALGGNLSWRFCLIYITNSSVSYDILTVKQALQKSIEQLQEMGVEMHVSATKVTGGEMIALH